LTRDGLKVVNKAADILAGESLLNPIMAKLSARERDAGEEFCHFRSGGPRGQACHGADGGR